ncbi:MAG: hypothetical protein WC700_09075 [Gemmatimonadaceae bacterium]|jgi:hypothetical protein
MSAKDTSPGTLRSSRTQALKMGADHDKLAASEPAPKPERQSTDVGIGANGNAGSGEIVPQKNAIGSMSGRR